MSRRYRQLVAEAALASAGAVALTLLYAYCG